MKRMQRAAAGLLLTLLTAATAHALEPNDVVILYNTKSDKSLPLALYYAKARNIPGNNILPLTCEPTDNISQAGYQDLVDQLRKGLAERGLTDKVKCLVTTYGVPYIVDAMVLTNLQMQESAAYQRDLEATINEMRAALFEYAAIAPDPNAATQPAANPTGKPWQIAAQQLNTAAIAASQRIANLNDASKNAALQQLMKMQERVAGLKGILSAIQINPNASGPDADRIQKQLDAMQNKLRELQTQYEALQTFKSLEDRRKSIALRRQSHGLVGQASQLNLLIDSLNPADTASCLDNELALALGEQNYPRVQWIMNPRNVEYYPVMQHLPHIPRTLIVTRLDGVTIERIEKMIDTSLEVEKKGLEGKLYLDARGIHDANPYGLYDADLRKAAEWVKSNSTMEAVLDDRPELLQAKDCPEAALYCGWYSLAKYVDSAQWVPGAVGYHVASLEMTVLHWEDNPQWVNNLLKRGFCGTFGPVSEPYVNSFPKPSLFFPLLLSGQFTQGEVWQLTTPMFSWRQGYIGDPLYNPFNAKPRVTKEALQRDTVLRNAFAIMGKEP